MKALLFIKIVPTAWAPSLFGSQCLDKQQCLRYYAYQNLKLSLRAVVLLNTK